ncbi:MAG: hypothetical protein H6702_09470 [Myxococcales bacterium]|nr:hypothetical protein [Myxococcales bacterium]
MALRPRRSPLLVALLAVGCASEDLASDAAAPVDQGQAFDALRFDRGALPPDRGVAPIDQGRPQDAALPEDAAPRLDLAPPGEACDGLDDDGDGQVDEDRACGPYIQAQCRLYLGWGQGGAVEYLAPSPTWGTCPAEDRDRDGLRQRCSGTRGDGAFARLNLPQDVDDDDWLAVALRCADPDGDPALAAYIQSHCAVFLGWDATARVQDGAAAWSACPASLSSSSGNLRCTSTGFDGRFLAMNFAGDVGDGHALGVAWICQDAADPDRAAHLTEAAAVYLGWADLTQGALDDSPTWGPCPAADGGEAAGQRCVGTRGDGAFRRLELGGDVADDDNLGVALRRR